MLFKKKKENTAVKKSKKGKIRENVEVILSAIAIALLIRIFVIEAYSIPTGSMIPNLLKGDRLIVNKFSFGVRLPILGWKLPSFTKPKRGDMVVFQTPTYKSVGPFRQFINLITFGVFNLDNTPNNPKIFVKRTVGTPGDIVELDMTQRVEMRNNEKQIVDFHKIVINGKQYLRKYLKTGQYVGNNVDIYRENNHIKKYKVQYFARRAIIKGQFYIPREGDVVVLRMAKKKPRTIPGINNDANIDSGNDYYVSGKVIMTINGRRTITVSGEIFDTIYNNLYNRVFPEKLIRTLAKKRKAVYQFKDNYYFMMGDNRDDSSDSRIWGLLKEDLIIGTPMLIYFPLRRFGLAN